MVRSADGRWTAKCKGCGIDFSPRRAKQEYHSRDCAEEHRAAWAKPKGGARAAAGPAERICLNLKCPRNGEPFQPARVSQLTCSRQCRDALPENRKKHRQADNHPERRARQNELRRPSSPVASIARVEANRKRNRKRQLAKYGITPEQYDVMLADQDGKCMICWNAPKPDGIKAASRLHLDHDHQTGRHRDLLCCNCNQAIGYFHDDPVLLRAAAEYIERHRA